MHDDLHCLHCICDSFLQVARATAGKGKRVWFFDIIDDDHLLSPPNANYIHFDQLLIIDSVRIIHSPAKVRKLYTPRAALGRIKTALSAHSPPLLLALSPEFSHPTITRRHRWACPYNRLNFAFFVLNYVSFHWSLLIHATGSSFFFPLFHLPPWSICGGGRRFHRTRTCMWVSIDIIVLQFNFDLTFHRLFTVLWLIRNCVFF